MLPLLEANASPDAPLLKLTSGKAPPELYPDRSLTGASHLTMGLVFNPGVVSNAMTFFGLPYPNCEPMNVVR